MKNNKDLKSIINSIEFIYEKKDGIYKEEVIDHLLLENIQIVSEFFSVSQLMAIILSIIAYEQLLEETATLRGILKVISISPSRAVDVYKELKIICRKGWLVQAPAKYSRNKGNYELSRRALEAIITEDKDELIPQQFETQDEALLEISRLVRYYGHEEDKEEMIEILIEQASGYIHYPFFNKILTDNKLKQVEKLILIWMGSEFVCGYDTVDLIYAIDHVFMNSDWLPVFKQRLSANGYMLTEEYISFVNPGIADLTSIAIGEKLIDLIGQTNKLKTKKIPNFNFCTPIFPDDILDTTLFFNQRNKVNMEEILSITDVANHERIVKRLKKENMPTGLAILLYGLPGTGKTETVKQLAKKQGRVILMVDISRFKSMWLGESEKNIKKIFKEYQAALSYYSVAPILLLNEADAILSKRSKVQHSVDQIMNNIQNILLQSLEDFNGILFATTNLVDNIDDAFDRRFMMKFKLDEPDIKTRFEIINYMLPEITIDLKKFIAENYSLTGAQIQNIKRRIITQKVIKGNIKIKKDLMEQLIEEEVACRSIQKPHQIIGFNNKSYN